jgi:hypothetical protein
MQAFDRGHTRLPSRADRKLPQSPKQLDDYGVRVSNLSCCGKYGIRALRSEAQEAVSVYARIVSVWIDSLEATTILLLYPTVLVT